MIFRYAATLELKFQIFFAVCYSGGDPLPGQKLKPRHSAYPKGIGPEAPAWVAFDRQVSFFSFKI